MTKTRLRPIPMNYQAEKSVKVAATLRQNVLGDAARPLPAPATSVGEGRKQGKYRRISDSKTKRAQLEETVLFDLRR